MARGSVAHQHNPKPVVFACDRAQELFGRFSSHIPVIQMVAVAWENDFWMCPVTARRIRGAKRPEKLVRNAPFGNMKQDGVARLRVLVNVILSGFGSVTLQIEVMIVIRKRSLQRKQKHSRKANGPH